MGVVVPPKFVQEIEVTPQMQAIDRSMRLKRKTGKGTDAVLEVFNLVQEDLFDTKHLYDHSLTPEQRFYRAEAERWAAKYAKYDPTQPRSSSNTLYRRVKRSEEDYLRFFTDYLEQFRVVAVDIETTGLDPNGCDILSIQFSAEQHTGFLMDWSVFAESEALRERLYQFISQRATCTVFHNMKFDIPFLAAKMFPAGKRRLRAERAMIKGSQDTQLMAYVILGEVATKKGRGNKKEGGLKLKNLVRKYFHMEMTDFDRLGRLDVNTTSGLVYSCRDADATLKLYDYLMAICPKDLYTILRLERDATIGIIEYERNGCPIHRDIVAHFKYRLLRRLQELEREIRAYPEFKAANLGSTPQIAHILYNVYKIPVTEFMKTEKGVPSTNEETLKTIQHFHPAIGPLLEHRKTSTLLKYYTDKILDKTRKEPILYPTVYQTSTRTGRLSEEDPNLQQIQKLEVSASEEDADKFMAAIRAINFRICFGKRPGYILLKADYSGQEVVVAAYLSGDPALRRVILEGHDIHAAMAIQVNQIVHHGEKLEPFNKAHQKIVKKHYKQLRTDVKPVTFGIFYGITKYSLALDILNDADRDRIFNVKITPEHDRMVAEGYLVEVNQKEHTWSWVHDSAYVEAAPRPKERGEATSATLNGEAAPRSKERDEATYATLLSCLREDEMNKVRDRAQGYIDNFYVLFPDFKKWQTRLVAGAKKTGVVRTLLGRTRKLDLEGYGWANQAKNTPIQGTCGDIMKYVSAKLALAIEHLDAHLLMTVHDEIVIECALKDRAECKRIMTEVMNAHILDLYPAFDLPLEVEVDECVNWGWTVQAYEKYKKMMVDAGQEDEVEWLRRFELEAA